MCTLFKGFVFQFVEAVAVVTMTVGSKNILSHRLIRESLIVTVALELRSVENH